MSRFSERMSPSLIRFLYSTAALIVLTVCVLNFYVQTLEHVIGNDQCRWIDKNQRVYITDIVHDGVSAHAGLQDGDVLAKVNGQTFKISAEAQQLINQKAGSYVTYTIERNGISFETRILILKLINVSFLAQFLYGIGFLIVGLVVVLVKPGGKLQRLFARYSILSMLFFGLSAININPLSDPMWQVRLLSISFMVASIFAPPLFVRFFFYFPVARRQKTKWLTIILYVLSAVIASVFALFRGDVWPRLVGTALIARYAFYVAGFFIFVHSYYKLMERNERKNLRPILIGVVLGIVVFLYAIIVGTVDPFAPFLNPIILLPLMLLVIVPVLFGYAIFRHGLMDMDIVVQRSLTYGAVTAVVAAIYLLTVFGLKSLLGYFFITKNDSFCITGIFITMK